VRKLKLGFLRKAWEQTTMKYVLIAVGLLAAVDAVLMGSASSPGGGNPPNPYVTEYGWLLNEWAKSFVAASVALAGAVVLSRGWSRWLLIVLLLVMWSNGIGPALHFVDYNGGVTLERFLARLGAI
jgi:hypothetical protein